MARKNRHENTQERVDFLSKTALALIKDKQFELAKYYIHQAKKICQKSAYKVKMPIDRKRFCKFCDVIFVPGLTSISKVKKDKSPKTFIRKCLLCKHERIFKITQ
ncbi:Ribonuclease P protein subunit p21 [Bonamia ostreae]|uniref:Ribonuclease P protein subunit p21 n=1 Tax=Bonamia ostreae TaxID=126728 RepID=A0ABV2ALF6_9EUKA